MIHFSLIRSISSLVYSMRTENIVSVMCHGRWIMKDQKIMNVDEVLCDCFFHPFLLSILGTRILDAYYSWCTWCHFRSTNKSFSSKFFNLLAMLQGLGILDGCGKVWHWTLLFLRAFFTILECPAVIPTCVDRGT